MDTLLATGKVLSAYPICCKIKETGSVWMKVVVKSCSRFLTNKETKHADILSKLIKETGSYKNEETSINRTLIKVSCFYG